MKDEQLRILISSDAKLGRIMKTLGMERSEVIQRKIRLRRECSTDNSGFDRFTREIVPSENSFPVCNAAWFESVGISTENTEDWDPEKMDDDDVYRMIDADHNNPVVAETVIFFLLIWSMGSAMSSVVERVHERLSQFLMNRTMEERFDEVTKARCFTLMCTFCRTCNGFLNDFRSNKNLIHYCENISESAKEGRLVSSGFMEVDESFSGEAKGEL